MKHISKLLGTLTFVGLVTTARPAAADKNFGAGSLIIPASAGFQTDCGAVSMYGLVYQLLRSNAWLETHGYTKIEIYYAFNDTKASPNRCTPTNLSAGPLYTGSPNPVPHDWPLYNDGCDITLSETDAATPPVKLVDTVAPFGADTNIVTISTTGRTTGTNRIWPGFASVTIQQTGLITTNVDTVRYGGGPFVIDSSDANTVIKLMRGTITAQANGVNIDFSPFANAAACTYGTTVGGNVNIHRAMTSFIAPNTKAFDDPPPRLALLARNRNQSLLDGGSGTTPGVNSKTGRVDNLILQKYLARGGLTFTGAQGCPVGGQIATDNPASCPSPVKVGEIYDLFDFADVVNGRLADNVAGVQTYKMLWAPHWQSKEAGSDLAPQADDVTGLNNIAAYLDDKVGLMAECASIESIEGMPLTQAVTAAQLQGCKDSSGACDASPTLYAFKKGNTNHLTGVESGFPVRQYYNCTDPIMVDTRPCFYFAYPGDPFLQIGDYRWNQDTGRVEDFLPNTGSIYRPGVKALVSSVKSLDKTKLGSIADARQFLVTADHVSRGFKDNDEDKAALLYLGGHDLSATVAGSKVVLQTLLQLGTPIPDSTYTEVTRSTPIVGTVQNTETALVQGTFISVNPAGTRKQATDDGAVDAFEFPYIKGHLRAISTTEIEAETDPATFGELTALFDTATLIPAPTFAGCAEFTSACRTVFTTLVKDCRPSGTPCTRTTLNQTNAAALGAVMAPDLTAGTGNAQEKLIERVLAGVPDGGSYSPALGGVDRSTIALIPFSPLANPGRADMIYVGAADGMMHAICANSDSPCDQAGRELWAYIPRNQLPILRDNTQRIEGSPRVLDMFIDTGTGKSFKTVLLFQTGSGDPASSTAGPAVYALDVSDPANPRPMWEYTTVGRGLTVTAGKLSNGKFAAFVQTNNGTGAAGTVVAAIDVETGSTLWSPQTFLYAPLRDVAHLPIPITAIPGGVVGLDGTNSGNITELLFTTIKGEIFQLDPTTGVNRHAPYPLFSFKDDYKPFGAAPTLYSDGTTYIVAASGGYTDLDSQPQWSSASVENQIVAVSANPAVTVPLVASAALDETSGLPGVKFATGLGLGRYAFAQVRVIGEELFLTTDTTDVNAATYGTTGAATGYVYQFNSSGLTENGNAEADAVVIVGGAGSVTNHGTKIMASSADKVEVLDAEAAGTTGPSSGINSAQNTKVTRRLWLRTL